MCSLLDSLLFGNSNVESAAFVGNRRTRTCRTANGWNQTTNSNVGVVARSPTN